MTNNQTQKPAPRNWLTIGQVAEELGLHRNTVYAMVRRGDLEALLYNKRVIRIPRQALENLLTTYKAGEFGLWASN